MGSSHRPFSSDEDEDGRHTVVSNEEQSVGDPADFPREVVRMPTPPPIVKRIVERVPTPEAYVIERVIVRPAPRRIVERIIERPRTPPPRVVHKEITEPAPPPIVRTRVVKVDSWSKNAVDYFYDQSSYPVVHESISHSYSRSGSPFSNYDTYNACPVGTKCESMSKQFPCYRNAPQQQSLPMQQAAHSQMGPMHNNNGGYFEQISFSNPSIMHNYHPAMMSHNQTGFGNQHPGLSGNNGNLPIAYYPQNNQPSGMSMVDYQYTMPNYDMNGMGMPPEQAYCPNAGIQWQGQQGVPYVYGYQHSPSDLYYASQRVY